MKLIVDECLAKSTKETLKKMWFEILEIDKILDQRALDEEIYNYVLEKQIAIITHDRGFGEIHFKANKNPPLTIIIEKISPHPEAANTLIQKSFEKIKITEKKYLGKLIIIISRVIRIRPKD